MSDKPIIYVAHPYRADTRSGVTRNISAARGHAIQVWRLGGVALSPCNNSAHMEDAVIPDEVLLSGDLQLLAKCDAILMTGFWECSKGCLAERGRASDLGIPVLYTMAHLTRFIAAWNARKEAS